MGFDGADGLAARCAAAKRAHQAFAARIELARADAHMWLAGALARADLQYLPDADVCAARVRAHAVDDLVAALALRHGAPPAVVRAHVRRLLCPGVWEACGDAHVRCALEDGDLVVHVRAGAQ